MSKIKISLLKINLLLIAFYIMFTYSIASTPILLLIFSITFILLLINFSHKKIVLTINHMFWIYVLCFILFSTMYSHNKSYALSYILMMGIFIFIKINLSNFSGWENYYIKFMYVFSGIHVICTLLLQINPNIVNEIRYQILTQQQLIVTNGLIGIGGNSGIAHQTGSNAFFITIFLAITSSKLIIGILKFNKINKYYFLLFILGQIAMMLTSKRAHLGINLIVFFILICVIVFKNKSIVINVLKMLTFIIVSICIGIIIFPEVLSIFEKIVLMIQSGDFSNGRIDIYKNIFEQFLRQPLLGNGFGDTFLVEEVGAHNIYIQLLNDIGIIGLLMFLVIFLKELIDMFKLLLNVREHGMEYVYIIQCVYVQIFFLLYGFTGNPLFDYYMLLAYIMATTIPRCYIKNNKTGELKNENRNYDISQSN